MRLLLDASLETQPQEAVEVDWGSPLTGGLVAAGLMGADAVVRRALAPQAGASMHPTRGGTAMQAVASTDSWVLTDALSLAADAPITLMAIVVSAQVSATRKRVIRLFNATNGSIIGIDFGNGSASTIEGFVQLPGAVFNQVQSSSANTPGVVQAVTLRRAGTSGDLFIDGQLSASTTFGGALLAGDATSVTLANSGSGFPLGADSGLLAYAVWNRALQTTEVQAVSANPWQLFRPTAVDYLPAYPNLPVYQFANLRISARRIFIG